MATRPKTGFFCNFAATDLEPIRCNQITDFMESVDDYLELNDLEVRSDDFMGSKIYYIDNFYKYPNELIAYLHTQHASLWKDRESPSYNGIFFEDRRHEIESNKIANIAKFLSNLCGDLTLYSRVRTNFTRFKRCSFNNFNDNYWWPHQDLGYTAIIYFNSSSTNLYEVVEAENLKGVKEHFAPWRSKRKFNIIKTIEPKFNSLVLFDGKKFFHGMNISDYTYFGSEYRTNQAIFLKAKD